jgi:hypothetical protein
MAAAYPARRGDVIDAQVVEDATGPAATVRVRVVEVELRESAA